VVDHVPAVAPEDGDLARLFQFVADAADGVPVDALRAASYLMVG
jgi:hypothetical protein